MKKLLKQLSPFAPDISGATAALFELGAITIICDAGGCTGNVCGFDEPRWFTQKSAIFSAGLRDMDAIMGRDDKLVTKLVEAAQVLSPTFTAIVGTPVPAVIATDYKALSRMTEKRTGLPCITIETTGTHYYDYGVALAQEALCRKFAQPMAVVPGRAAILGATPLDTSSTCAAKEISAVKNAGFTEVFALGMGSGLEQFRQVASAEKLFVLSPAGLPAARFLHEKFGTPYACLAPINLPDLSQVAGTKALVIHQQFRANAARAALEARGIAADVATWFTLDAEFATPSDFRLTEEEQLSDAVTAKGYDLIIADRALKRLVPQFTGTWIDFPHFALSGNLDE